MNLEDKRVPADTERLRSTLLSSLSHDLRSPLAAILGASTSLESYGEDMNREDRRSLLEIIRLEGERLDSYIQNLLDMIRLEHGGFTLNCDWISVDELVSSATRRLQRYQPFTRFQVQIAHHLAPIWVHFALVEQSLFNVIENAAKFALINEPITIEAYDVDGQLRIDIRDRGPGIPEEERKCVFDLFYSVERGDRGRKGSGLGLTISQGLIAAHGGSVEALPSIGQQGTTIRMTLPHYHRSMADTISIADACPVSL